jgi:hypothetical protein
MSTLNVDDRKRVRIPTAKPKQVFSFQPNADGSILLVPVREQDRTELFPPGSLLKYFSGKLGRERDERGASLLSGCVQAPE